MQLDLYFRSNSYSTMGRLLFPLATNKDWKILVTCITVTQYSIWQIYSSAVEIDELNFQKRCFQTEEFLETKFESCDARSCSYSSILHAGKDSSCITTVLLLAKTMMLRSCCFSWVSWYHSLITSESWVGIKVTCNTKWKSCWMDRRNSGYAKCLFEKSQTTSMFPFWKEWIFMQ